MKETALKENLAPVHVPPAKVAVLISTQITGGPAKGLLQLIPALQAYGHARIVLCVFHKPGAPESPFMRACREHGIEVVPLWQWFNYDPRPLWQLIRLMRARGITLLQTHGYKENLCGLLVRRFIGRPWICFLHGTTQENLKVRLYHALDRFVVRFADRIVAVSAELLQRTVTPRHLQKASVIENAIEPRAGSIHPFLVAKWKRRHGVCAENVIVCVGRLSPEKGQELLLTAVRGLAGEGLDFQLLLVGDGPDRPRLEQLCAELDLQRHVKFMGHLNGLEMIYAAADILVLPSFKEGMPNVILEAMANGVPIVSTRVGAVPDMLRDGHEALLVPPADALALQRALATMLRDPAQARRMGEAGRRALFPRFSVARRVANVAEVYRVVCRRRVAK